MKKILILPLLLIIFIISGCGNKDDKSMVYSFDEDGTMTVKPVKDEKEENEIKKAEKLEIYYFHRNARCVSCNLMEEMVKNLIDGQYAGQVENGKIDFKSLNVESAENKEIALKYKASGSALFINRIIDGDDNIENEANAWRYLNNESNFNRYLGAKIDSYLGL
jgi:thioredoxin-related protein